MARRQAGATTAVVGVAVCAIWAAESLNLKQLTASFTGQPVSDKTQVSSFPSPVHPLTSSVSVCFRLAGLDVGFTSAPRLTDFYRKPRTST